MDMAALVIAGLSALVAALAWFQSRKSADAAAGSAKAAAESLTLSREQDARQKERVDVAFTLLPNPNDARWVRVRHTGSTEARNVTVTVFINSEYSGTVSELSVQPDDVLTFDGSEAFREASSELARMLEYMITTLNWNVEVRITWESPLGAPGSQTVRN